MKFQRRISIQELAILDEGFELTLIGKNYLTQGALEKNLQQAIFFWHLSVDASYRKYSAQLQ